MAVGDGAEWIQGFVDFHRPDARRILDISHAAERFTTIQQSCQDAGVDLDELSGLSRQNEKGGVWAEARRRQLKAEGGTAVLADLRRLQEDYPQIGLDEPLNYLAKREAMLQYPQFLLEGWPIGSGAIESANKLVVEARLKGAGMHWHPDNVNPMLALRSAVCSDRWEEVWPTIALNLKQRNGDDAAATEVEAASAPGPNPVLAYYKEMQRLHRDWERQQREVEAAKPKQPWKPAPDHPWRRPWRKR